MSYNVKKFYNNLFSFLLSQTLSIHFLMHINHWLHFRFCFSSPLSFNVILKLRQMSHIFPSIATVMLTHLCESRFPPVILSLFPHDSICQPQMNPPEKGMKCSLFRDHWLIELWPYLYPRRVKVSNMALGALNIIPIVVHSK